MSRTHITAPLCVALVAAGCATTPSQEPQARAEARASSAQGLVSFEQVADPEAQRPVADTGHEYLRPRLEEGFALPAYPEQALAANAPPTEVVVRLVVGADGSVTSIRPSPLAGLPTGEWSTLFYDAVRNAVAGWRYDPCQLRELEDGPDINGDGSPDYRLVVASTPVPVYLDIRFRFEIIAGVGQVSMGTDGG